jgi:hypothetical protein
MNERDFNNNLAKVLGETFRVYVTEPVNEHYQKMRDAEYRQELLGRTIDRVHLALVFALAVGCFYGVYSATKTHDLPSVLSYQHAIPATPESQ